MTEKRRERNKKALFFSPRTAGFFVFLGIPTLMAYLDEQFFLLTAQLATWSLALGGR
ncbi:MAG: hypothetical protein ACLT3W_01630 [Bifidobacterium pseudocatenulatum]